MSKLDVWLLIFVFARILGIIFYCKIVSIDITKFIKNRVPFSHYETAPPPETDYFLPYFPYLSRSDDGDIIVSWLFLLLEAVLGDDLALPGL